MSTVGAGTRLPDGISTQVRVPASSANLGPGFDCLGVALGIYDDLEVTATPGPSLVEVSGEGAGSVPTDDTHLVVRALRRGLSSAGVDADGLHLRCRNSIPHSRGLGSSAAAVVSGLAAASGLLDRAGHGRLSDEVLVQLAGEFEGHPDNAAASVLGSAVVTWTVAGDDGVTAYRARRLELHPDIVATAFVPDTESSTSFTRALLPDQVPRADAVFNLSRAALAVVALTSAPETLFDATADTLHQGYRSAAMPETAGLVEALRHRGRAATVSGAGPTVLLLGTEPVDAELEGLATDLGFVAHRVEIAHGVQIS
nr:homoserine kinase [Gordonia soli]